MITPRENMFRVLRHEMPEWIPLCGHVDPYNQPSKDGMDPELAKALANVQWSDGTTVAFSRHLGLDVMDYMPMAVHTQHRNATLESKTEGDDTIQTWHTPAGDIRQVVRRCREDGTSYVMEHFVKTPADLPVLAALFEDEANGPNPKQRERIAERRALIGDDGMLMCFMAGTPLGMMYRVYSGVEALAYLHADAPDALRDLFRVMERSYQEQLRIGLDSGHDVFVGMDDTSTNTISPAMFAEYNLALTDARADLCHAAGKIYFHHSCGLIHDLLPIYRRTRMDAVHAFTEPPIGNVTLADGRRMLGDRIAIIAGIGPMADPGWDVARMKEDVRRSFAQAMPGDNIIFSIAAYPHRTMAETRQLAEECRRYQPIDPSRRAPGGAAR